MGGPVHSEAGIPLAASYGPADLPPPESIPPPGRFPFTSWSTGEMLVPEAALAHLAVEGIAFSVEGPAKYEQAVPAFRGTPPAPAAR